MAACFLATIPQQAWADDPVDLPDFYYYHSDHLGSCTLLSDSSGNRVRHYGYTAYGNDLFDNYSSGYEQVSNRFTGQVFDEETGLYYYGARYYDPELARFIQPDPVVPEPDNPQALNRYSYCVNNPLKYIDPTGNFFGIIGAIASFFGVTSTQLLVAMAVGAAIGAGMAAIMGGNILQGALCGAIGGMFGVGGCPVMAMAGGALGALVTGGDPMMGAFTAGITAGISICFSESPLPSAFTWIGDEYLQELALSTVCGALTGGVTAEMFGGNFGTGAAYGAISASAGYVVAIELEDFLIDLKLTGDVGLTGSEPAYDPDLWNDPDYIDYNNCYAYAADDPVPYPQRTSKPQPGNMAGQPFGNITVDEVQAAAIADGMRYLGTDPSSMSSVANGEYAVGLVVDPGKDYHWYRRNPNGTWSHKPGGTPATNIDASGNLILNPRNANRDYGVLNYSQWGGYFAVPSEGIRVK